MAALVLAGWAPPAFAASPLCTRALGIAAAAAGPVKTLGTVPVAVQLPVAPGHTYLIQVEERGNDALVEVIDSHNQVLARADHPERRTGTRRVVLTAPQSPQLLIRVTGKEHEAASGTATVQAFDLQALQGHADCLALLRTLAEGDSDYAAGKEISSGHASSSTASAHEQFTSALHAYSTAERGLNASADQPLRGEAELALAALEYQDLQDWAKAAEWAETAAKTLGTEDPYRRARAEAMLAAAWIQIGSTSPADGTARGSGADATGLLARARSQLQRLVRFHLQRGEEYDAGLQLANISMTYAYEGRYQECVGAAAGASRLFGSLHETQRRALAWQNQALCLWGLGQLPEARRWYGRALNDIGPEPYPNLHLIALTNTAIADYALGRIDESLRLFDEALAFANKVQSTLDVAYCLYGIGVNYYALGDRQRAREFLERSLEIRTVALDGRGRMSSLRALANIDAEEERLEEALKFDQEALGLAVAPLAVARIKIQRAAHTAAAGHPEEAEALLREVLAPGATTGLLIRGEALVQRAKLLRATQRPREALADLKAARPLVHRFGSVMEEFEADLEVAEALRQVGQPRAALAAVERALAQSDAVRLQTANPELRAQLQTPLRPAYDLKLELLRDQYEQALAAGHEQEAQALAAVAFAAADASRAHTFADVAAQRYSPAVRRALAPEFRRREELYRELSDRRFTLDTRLERSGPDDPRARRLVADIAELRREVDAVNTVIAARTMTDSAQVRGGGELAGVPALAADTALVSYWLGRESAYAWVLSAREIHWARLAPPAEIGRKALALHGSLTRLVDVPVETRMHDASILYGLIVRPLEPWLSRAGSWVIIPDGALDYVPFAALRADEGQKDSFVVLRHNIAVTPAAWMLQTSRGEAAADLHKILLVADPVYQADDPRRLPGKEPAAAPGTPGQSARGSPQREYGRLGFTAEEAAGIAAQLPPTDLDELTGLDATRERLLALDWSQYRFIHIATHGVADAQVPELSALILGYYDARGRVADPAVRVADVALKSLAAQVLVLSACETALGPQVRSEGLVGLSSTFLARGARSVVASLWPVPDETGASLMIEFYRHMLHDSMSPEAALGAAMRSTAARAPSADPALWAEFQISMSTLAPRP